MKRRILDFMVEYNLVALFLGIAIAVPISILVSGYVSEDCSFLVGIIIGVLGFQVGKIIAILLDLYKE